MQKDPVFDLHANGGDLSPSAPDPGLRPPSNLDAGIMLQTHRASDIQQSFDRAPYPARIPRQTLQKVHRKEHPLPRPVVGGKPSAQSTEYLDAPSLQLLARDQEFMSIRALSQSDDGCQLREDQGARTSEARTLRDLALQLLQT